MVLSCQVDDTLGGFDRTPWSTPTEQIMREYLSVQHRSVRKPGILAGTGA